MNKGALTRTYDENTCIRGLHIIVNGVDVRNWLVHGLHGQLAFFYVKDLRIERFRCLDMGSAQYGIHICTFEYIIIDDVIIKGDKDGVVENCHDLADGKEPVGFFCRILAGGWTDWHEAMEVRQSDIVVCHNRLYRVHAQPDGTCFISMTAPFHSQGLEFIDDIPRVMTQEDIT